MTEHLPECPVAAARPGTFTSCICDRLEACEQRMFALHPEWTVTGMCKPECAACRRLTELITEWEYGYEKGIDAAREAVAATFIGWCKDYMNCTDYEHVCGNRREIITAIDGLRETR